MIVQQQVDADSAGVAFSLNPLNNCFDEAVINANHGLGESVVSGEADPDVFVVDKLKREIIETRIGGKQAVITLNQAGGTTRSTRASHQEASITPAQVLELTGLLEQVEALLSETGGYRMGHCGRESCTCCRRARSPPTCRCPMKWSPRRGSPSACMPIPP